MNGPYDERGEDPGSEEVRRLLAAAGSQPPPIPRQVADRLDEVLDRLVTDRTRHVTLPSDLDDHLGGPVLPTEVVGGMEPATRRRHWPQVLAAAAAVSVLGLGVTTLLDQDSGGDSAMSTDAAGSAAELAEGDETVDQLTPRLSSPALRVQTASQLTDVQRIEDLALARPADGDHGLGRACVSPRISAGDEWTRIRLDGAPAVLVLRAPVDGQRTADVFSCNDEREPVLSTTVTAH
jgi:hypothetical protein